MSTSSRPYYQQSICAVFGLPRVLAGWLYTSRRSQRVIRSNQWMLLGVRRHNDMIQANADQRHRERSAINDKANVTSVRPSVRPITASSLYYRPESLYRRDVVVSAGLEQSVLVKSAGPTWLLDRAVIGRRRLHTGPHAPALAVRFHGNNESDGALMMRRVTSYTATVS